VIDPPAKYTNTEVAGDMIEQHSTHSSGFVTFPARHWDVRIKIRPVRQSQSIEVELPL